MNMLSLRRLFLLLALCLSAALLAPVPGAHAQNVFTVDDNGDGGDTNAGDGVCQTSGGACTLRAALEETNALANVDASTPDSIAFSISTSDNINPSTALPEITDPVVIDGTTASPGVDFSRLRIDGAKDAETGLVISAGESTVRGLQILRFPENGITLKGNGGNVIENCQIGDFIIPFGPNAGDPAGVGNDGSGILITGGSTQNRIGDSDDAGARNIIGGNGGSGIRIDGGDPGGTNNRIYGNYIGVAADGETDLGNTGHGVLLENQTRYNNVGSSQTGTLGNVISGNGGSGVKVSGTFGNAASANTSNNRIFKNRIGLNDAGDTAVPNDEHGVDVDGATETSVGGTGAGASIISGNAKNGVRLFGKNITVRGNRIGTDVAGTTAIGNGSTQAGIILVGATSGVTIGGSSSAYRNVISGNERGIVLNSATDNVIEGNYIGVDFAGDAALGNEFEGIRLGGASQNNTIGGTADGAGNVISGNGTDGILFTGGSATGNTVSGNHIGTNASGDAALGNGESGIVVEDGGNTIGGTAGGARNVISGNEKEGILVLSNGNVVQGNYIGTNAAGDAALGNGSNGNSRGLYGGAVTILASNNTVGGLDAAARNVISGNEGNGTDSGNGITMSGPGATGNVVIGNYVGVNAAGDAALSNAGHGIQVVANASGNRIGVDGSDTVVGNVVSGNQQAGIELAGSVNNTLVKGNLVGVGADGSTPVGNSGNGVWIKYSAGSDNVVGYGPGAKISRGRPDANVIAHNGKVGVLISEENSSASGNSVRINRIFANSSLGLDISEDNANPDGQTANDPGDGDDGINNLQNFPEIESADYDAGTGDVTVTYLVDTAPANATYPLEVDFYQADADEEEGAAYLGTDPYTSTDHGGCGAAPCTKTVTFTPQTPVTRSDLTVATATDADGNTSEFSAQAQQLPVELAAFEATPDGAGAVALTWQTASEANNDRFRVERQRGGDAGWAKLGTRQTQAPGGTSAEALRYRFEDTRLPFEASALTYRLIQRDRDGHETTVGEKTVEIGAPTAFTLHGSFPNPMRRRTTIRYELPEKRHVTLAVYDALGRKVRTLVDEEQTGRQEIPFEAGGLASGTYFYRITAGSGYTETRKLVLVR